MAQNFEEADAQAEFNEFRNDFGRIIQTLTLVDANGTPTRNAFISLDQAIEQLEENFEFEEGKRYLIKYLTSQRYKAGQMFTYDEDTNIADYVWSEDDEQERYGAQALSKEEIHVFSIVVEEIKP